MVGSISVANQRPGVFLQEFLRILVAPGRTVFIKDCFPSRCFGVGSIHPHIGFGARRAPVTDHFKRRFISVKKRLLHHFLLEGIVVVAQIEIRGLYHPVCHHAPADIYIVLSISCFQTIQRNGIDILCIHDAGNQRWRRNTLRKQLKRFRRSHNGLIIVFCIYSDMVSDRFKRSRMMLQLADNLIRKTFPLALAVFLIQLFFTERDVFFPVICDLLPILFFLSCGFFLSGCSLFQLRLFFLLLSQHFCFVQPQV